MYFRKDMSELPMHLKSQSDRVRKFTLKYNIYPNNHQPTENAIDINPILSKDSALASVNFAEADNLNVGKPRKIRKN